ncbi:MAG: hypothetical protein HQL39_17075 [Alphaproteobacteria bacterium]|nr:hypothetical protein [Alphaproteobacteria bacterium]
MLRKIVEIARGLAHPTDKARIYASEEAFADAFTEADFDAHFLKIRRGNQNGNSEGKMAGLLYFRLTRHRIIHLPPEIVDHSHYKYFQEKVIIKIVGSLMKVDFNDPWILEKNGTRRPGGRKWQFQDIYSELQYLTCRRHYNQESLALFFDTAIYLQEAIDEIRRIKDSPD